MAKRNISSSTRAWTIPATGGASAVGYVGHGACDGSGDGYASEKRHHYVGHALTYELGVAVGARAGDTVGHGGAQKRFDGSKHGDGEG